MKQISISLHSFVDIITNSSTEIYTNPVEKAVESMYEILNTFLKIAGVKTDSKELFDVHYEATRKISTPEEEESDDYDEYDYDDCDPYEVSEEVASKIRERYLDDYDSMCECLTLVVKDKAGKYNNIMSDIQGLFNTEACENR